jgi:C4-type Zn-finger protein
VVKSDSATVNVEELEFEIPPGTQKGTITTVEGLLREAADAICVLQPQRVLHDPETAAAIAQFLGMETLLSSSQLLPGSFFDSVLSQLLPLSIAC